MAKNKNKLTVKAIKNAQKKEFIQKKVTVEIDGKEYDIMVDQKFSMSKIQAMAIEGMEKFKRFKELPDVIQLGYFSYLMLKHFTDLDLKDAKSFEDDIQMMDSLLDLGVYEKVMPEFPEEEINKINKYMNDVKDKINELTEEEIKQLEDVMSEVTVTVDENEEGENLEPPTAIKSNREETPETD